MNSTVLTLAGRYLSRRKERTVLTILAILLGVMVAFGLNDLATAFADSFASSADDSTLQLDLIVSNPALGTFSEEAGETVSGVAGVEREGGLLLRDLLLPKSIGLTNADGQELTTIRVFGLDPDASSWLLNLGQAEGRDIAAGRSLQAGDEDVVIISQGLADGMDIGVGDTVTLPSASGTTDFEVVGIQSGASVSLGEEQVYVPLSAAQRLFDMPGLVTAVAAQYAPDADEEATTAAALAALGEGYQGGSLESGGGAWESAFELAGVIFSLFGVLSVAMAGFIIFNTFRAVVVERRRDIGMLRAIGASRRTVMGLMLTESLIQAVIGTALGLLAGYGLAVLGVRAINPAWQSFVYVPLGAPRWTLFSVLLPIGLGVGIPLLSAWLPARSASQISPMEALRPVSAEVERRAAGQRAIVGVVLVVLSLVTLVTRNVGVASVGALLFLAGLVLIGPALVYPVAELFGWVLTRLFAREGQLAQSNLVRQPSRAAVTASTMTISLAIVLALIGLTNSRNAGLIQYMEKSLSADYMLTPESLVLGSGNAGAGAELAEAVRAIPGVVDVATLRQANTQVNGAGLQLVGLDPATYPIVSGLNFTSGEEAQAYDALTAGRSIIINGILASQEGLKIGDELTLKTLAGPQTYQISGIGFDYLNVKLATGYLSQANLAQDFGATADVFIMADLEPNANRTEVETALIELTRDYPAFNVLSSEQLRESQLSTVEGLSVVMNALVGVLAIPSLLAVSNTLGINVLERTRELGMLRAIGSTRRQIRRMILAESLLLVAMGIALGILTGIWLGYVLVGATSAVGIPLPYFFPYMGILIATAIGLLFGVLAALAPARRAAQLDIVQALAYE